MRIYPYIRYESVNYYFSFNCCFIVVIIIFKMMGNEEQNGQENHQLGYAYTSSGNLLICIIQVLWT